LAVDAWLDSSIYDGGSASKTAYEDFSSFMDRFHISGWRRLGVELCCEALTLGLGAAIVALMLAVPAFRETTDDWLKKQDLAVTFLDRNGIEIGRRGILHDDGVPLEKMPPFLTQAVLATEDRRFYEHFGIDIIGTMRALTVNARSAGVVQGGSSITQQLAKNLFLSNQRTIERKIREAYLAVWLEFHLTKKQILQLYLDRVYMGGGTFGIQAASEFYFGKSVRDVSLAEAAMLAGLFKAPTKYAPHINLPAARARANDVLSNLVDAGYMTEGEVRIARENPATPVDRTRDVSPDWYLDYAYDEVRKLVDAGKLGETRVFTVRTAIDMDLQKKAEASIEDELREHGPAYHAKQSATVIVDLDGAVHAMVGGRDYGESQFNRAIDAQRQPGSSFKPFVYLTALMTGRFKPNTIVVDGPVCIGNWCPHNFETHYLGSIPLVTALAQSLNTVAIKLSIAIGNGNSKVGRAKIVENAHRLGLTTPLEDTVSLPIGADEVTVIDMASAYAAFANGGQRVPPYAAIEIRNGRGDLVYRHDRDGPKPEQVVPASDVATLNNMLTHVVSEGTGRNARLDNVTASGKTGTTNAFHDAWFCGFTGNYAGVVWYGNDDYTSMNKMTGGTLPAMTWHDIMTFAHQGIDTKPPFGVEDNRKPAPTPATPQASAVGQPVLPARTASLSHEAAGIIVDIGSLMHSAGQQRSATTRDLDFAADASGRPAAGKIGLQ
jgi:penicillin-binding protein 1A